MAIIQRPTDNANLWRVPQYGDMEMLRATFVKHRFDLHYHEEYVVGVIERGQYEFYFEGDTVRIHRGEVVLINPQEIHSGYAIDVDGWSYRTFYPAVTLMRQIAQEMTGNGWQLPVFHKPIIKDMQVSRAILQAHYAMEANAPRLTTDELLRDALSLLIARHASHKPVLPKIADARQTIKQVQDYMQTHFADDITLDDLAEVAGYSPFYLSRMFRRTTGLPPHKYLTQIRVHRARDLLNSGLSIADAAVDVGFADQSHLTRWFKRIMGVTPGQYLTQTH